MPDETESLVQPGGIPPHMRRRGTSVAQKHRQKEKEHERNPENNRTYIKLFNFWAILYLTITYLTSGPSWAPKNELCVWDWVLHPRFQLAELECADTGTVSSTKGKKVKKPSQTTTHKKIR